MKKGNFKILIIDKSDLIKQGLRRIFEDNINNTFIIELHDVGQDWQLDVTRVRPQIVIANPFIFEDNKKYFQSLKQKQNFYMVGLVYTYHHPDNLKNCDAVIYLQDSSKQINTTIKKLLKSSLSVPNITSEQLLSDRETEVLKFLANGYSSKTIADTLHISTHTVNNHRKNISRKLDIKTVSGLTIYAVLNNIINLDDV